MFGFLFLHVEELVNRSPNGELTVLVEGIWKPERASIRQRTKASIEMTKARVHQLDGYNQTAQQFADRAMRLDVAAELVSANESFAAKQWIAFALEIQIVR